MILQNKYTLLLKKNTLTNVVKRFMMTNASTITEDKPRNEAKINLESTNTPQETSTTTTSTTSATFESETVAKNLELENLAKKLEEDIKSLEILKAEVKERAQRIKDLSVEPSNKNIETTAVQPVSTTANTTTSSTTTNTTTSDTTTSDTTTSTTTSNLPQDSIADTPIAATPVVSMQEQIATLDRLASEVKHTENIVVNDTTDLDEIAKKINIIKASCITVGAALATKLKQQNIDLKETENAIQRQKALLERITEFIKDFGINRKAVLKIGLTLGVGYTMYHILRYREIPFGGFLKSLASTSSGGTTSTGDISSSIVGPTNNITINLPDTTTAANISNMAAKVVKESTLGSTIGNFIDNLGPGASLVLIGGAIWLLRRIK